MARYAFWILLGACILVAAGVWAVSVRKGVLELEDLARQVEEKADVAVNRSGGAVGPETIRSLEEAQGRSRSDLARLEQRFRDIDERNLEQWFDTLDLDWSKVPEPSKFKRAYALERDRLHRELTQVLKSVGVEGPAIPLIDKEWLSGDAEPAKDELRWLQKEFWMQDRILRALVRLGATPTRAVRGGEPQNAIGAGTRQLFSRVRFDLQVRCSPRRVSEVIHAFDRPFEFVHEDGSKEVGDLPIICDNVSVRRIVESPELLAEAKTELPVEVGFYLTVLDFETRGKTE